MDCMEGELETLTTTLMCLIECFKMPYPLFKEYKEQIMDVLDNLKDNRKRIVRKYAVFACNKLYILK